MDNLCKFNNPSPDMAKEVDKINNDLMHGNRLNSEWTDYLNSVPASDKWKAVVALHCADPADYPVSQGKGGLQINPSAPFEWRADVNDAIQKLTSNPDAATAKAIQDQENQTLANQPINKPMFVAKFNDEAYQNKLNYRAEIDENGNIEIVKNKP